MNAYTVIYLFDYSDPSRLLMVLKDRTFNRGKFNGVGGKVEDGEDVLQCAVREVKEETGAELSKDDLYYLGAHVVDDCTNKPGTQGQDCILHFLTGWVFPQNVSQQPEETECLAWIPYATTQSHPEFFPADIPDTVRSAATMLQCAGAEN